MKPGPTPTPIPKPPVMHFMEETWPDTFFRFRTRHERLEAAWEGAPQIAEFDAALTDAGLREDIVCIRWGRDANYVQNFDL